MTNDIERPPQAGPEQATTTVVVKNEPVPWVRTLLVSFLLLASLFLSAGFAIKILFYQDDDEDDIAHADLLG